MKNFASILIFATLCSNTFAATLYRHVPFNLTINANDLLIVDYDIAGKNGIRCEANHKNINVNFTYKGCEKSERLPITLQSDHVPKNNEETVADVSGQFVLRLDPNHFETEADEVNCRYIS